MTVAVLPFNFILFFHSSTHTWKLPHSNPQIPLIWPPNTFSSGHVRGKSWDCKGRIAPVASLLARNSCHFSSLARCWCPCSELNLSRKPDWHLSPGCPTAWPPALLTHGPGRNPFLLWGIRVGEKDECDLGYVVLSSNPIPVTSWLWDVSRSSNLSLNV